MKTVWIVSWVSVFLAFSAGAGETTDPLAKPGAADLLRAAAAQAEAGDVQAARATLQTLGLGAAAPAAAEADPERVMALYGQGEEAMRAGDVDEAKARWSEALEIARDERARGYLGTMLETISVVGEPAGSLSVDRVIQGDMPTFEEGTTLVFFFEPWCPHCQEEMPELQKRLATLDARGISLVGLTRLSRESTVRDVRQLARSSGARFPLAVETGEVAVRFGVQGIPAAAVVRDGVIVWRGHPKQLGDVALDRFATE